MRKQAAVLDHVTDAASQLKLFVLDEAWRFAQDGTLKAYITEALKTWRKRNAAMLLATQIAVIRAGRVEQCASPNALASSPATPYVRMLLQRARIAEPAAT